MENKIRGNIVKILSENEFLINRGEIQGVKRGAKFKIVAKEIQVTDIDERALGVYVHTKGELYVADVYGEFSHCKTGTITEWEEEVVPSAHDALLSMAKIWTIPKTHKKVKSTRPIMLSVDDDDTENLDLTIRVGDTIIQE